MYVLLYICILENDDQKAVCSGSHDSLAENIDVGLLDSYLWISGNSRASVPGSLRIVHTFEERSGHHYEQLLSLMLRCGLSS